VEEEAAVAAVAAVEGVEAAAVVEAEADWR